MFDLPISFGWICLAWRYFLLAFGWFGDVFWLGVFGLAMGRGMLEMVWFGCVAGSWKWFGLAWVRDPGNGLVWLWCGILKMIWLGLGAGSWKRFGSAGCGIQEMVWFGWGVGCWKWFDLAGVRDPGIVMVWLGWCGILEMVWFGWGGAGSWKWFGLAGVRDPGNGLVWLGYGILEKVWFGWGAGSWKGSREIAPRHLARHGNIFVYSEAPLCNYFTISVSLSDQDQRQITHHVDFLYSYIS